MSFAFSSLWSENEFNFTILIPGSWLHKGSTKSRRREPFESGRSREWVSSQLAQNIDLPAVPWRWQGCWWGWSWVTEYYSLRAMVWDCGGGVLSYESRDMCNSLWPASFTQHIFKIHHVQHVSVHISFYCWVIVHCMDIPHCIYPIISWWTFGLFPLWGK